MYLLLAATPLTSSRQIHANTLMESTIGLFMTELIKPQRPWKTLSKVELAVRRMDRLAQSPPPTR
jgi:hypothetical protein